MSLTDPAALAARRTFEAVDVFFSTTDRRGIIRHANGTFLRLAALREADAIGFPHNLIRHPEVPGGAFRLIWDELEAGRPVSAYLPNLAKDGVRYDVLATIVPIEGGYLSVRLRPGLRDLEAEILGVYDDVASREATLRQEGAGRRSAAERGGALLRRALARLGYGSMAAFTRTVLPREVDALVRDLPRAPARVDGPLGDAVDVARQVVSEASGLASRLVDLEAAAQRVALDQDNLTPLVRDLDGVRQEVARVVDLLEEAGGEAALSACTREVAETCGDVIDGIEGLPVERLREALADLSLRVAIVRLLAQMIARFALEVTATGPEERGTELRLLHSALARQVADADAGAARVTELLGVVPELLTVTRAGARRLAQLGESWAAEITRPATQESLGGAAAEAGALAMAAEADLAVAAEGLAPLADGVSHLDELGTQVGLGAVPGLVARLGAGLPR